MKNANFNRRANSTHARLRCAHSEKKRWEENSWTCSLSSKRFIDGACFRKENAKKDRKIACSAAKKREKPPESKGKWKNVLNSSTKVCKQCSNLFKLSTSSFKLEHFDSFVAWTIPMWLTSIIRNLNHETKNAWKNVSKCWRSTTETSLEKREKIFLIEWVEWGWQMRFSPMFLLRDVSSLKKIRKTIARMMFTKGFRDSTAVGQQPLLPVMKLLKRKRACLVDWIHERSEGKFHE